MSHLLSQLEGRERRAECLRNEAQSEEDLRKWLGDPANYRARFGLVEAGLVCLVCAGDAPRGKCQNPKCIGGPIVRELVPAPNARAFFAECEADARDVMRSRSEK